MRFRDQMERLYQGERGNPLYQWAFRDGHLSESWVSSGCSQKAPLHARDAPFAVLGEGRGSPHLGVAFRHHVAARLHRFGLNFAAETQSVR